MNITALKKATFIQLAIQMIVVVDIYQKILRAEC